MEENKMYYHFKIHKEEDGYWADCIELIGCATKGNSFNELEKNIEEALNLYLDEPDNSDVTFPLPSKEIEGDDIVEVPVNPNLDYPPNKC